MAPRFPLLLAAVAGAWILPGDSNAAADCSTSKWHYFFCGHRQSDNRDCYTLTPETFDCSGVGNGQQTSNPKNCAGYIDNGTTPGPGNCPNVSGNPTCDSVWGVGACPNDLDVASDTCGDFACVPGTGVCDGIGEDGGCWNSDEKSCSAAGRDTHPLVFSTGQVSTQPITLLSLDGVDGLPLSYFVRYDSHNARVPSFSQHFLGLGWTDSYSDRLVANGTTTYEWSSIEGTITFLQDDATHFHSRGLDYRLTDNGVGASPRFTIVSMKPYDVHRVWNFTYRTDAQQNSWGELSSRQAAGYLQTISRWTDGRINTVTDNLLGTSGRTLSFNWSLSPQDNQRYLLSSVGVSFGSGPTTNFASFVYTSDWQLDRIDHAGTYHRFLYLPISDLQNGAYLITDVIVPAIAASTPAVKAPLQSNEIVLEHHDFYDDPSQVFPKGQRTSGPGRSFAYVYNTGSTTQLDLHQQGTACTPSCATGYACWDTASGGDNMCYVAHVESYDTVTDLPTGIDQDPNGSGGASGGTTRVYDPTSHVLKASIDSDGRRTTYGYDSSGNTICIVYNDNDNDNEALVNPSNPALGCATPTTSLYQIVNIAYGASSVTKSMPSQLGGPAITWEDDYDTNGLLLHHKVTGTTRDIDENPQTPTRDSATSYDTFGRVASTNGPLADTQAYDATSVVYWTTAPAGKEANLGEVQTVTRYVGTLSSHTSLTTTYDNYDAWGVPHTITDPAGTTTTLTTTDRLSWTITVQNGASATSHVTLNPNGTVLDYIDADNICTMFDYRAADGTYMLVPTKIRRSSSTSNCGVVPIDDSTGEVEIRAYTANEPDRIASITRKMNGTIAYQVSNFTYDTKRELTQQVGLNSSNPYTMTYTDGTLSSTQSPGWPTAPSWRSDIGIDDLARPAYLYRYLSSSSKQTYAYGYANAWAPLPTSISRGIDGGATSVTTFVYDDFGELIKTVSPDHGTVDFEYDVGGRVVKSRYGAGTSDVRTSQTTYDSLGRKTFVDNDLEHPVNCATALNGTPVADEEYRYDNCTGDAPTGFTCNNAAGRLTIARTITNCSGGVQIKRGRWYSYDFQGHPTVAFATVGTFIGTPAIMTEAWTPGGRLSQITSPLNAGQGTSYTFDTQSGNPSTVIDLFAPSSTSPPAGGITYLPFGRPTFYAGVNTTTFTKLWFAANYRNDGTLQSMFWTNRLGPLTETYFLYQSYLYNASGLLSDRHDDALMANSRSYTYDSLLRLTCETRGTASSYATTTDCNQSSPNLAGLFTYYDGDTASHPPDNRATAYLKATGYSNGSADGYNYQGSGSSRLMQLTRTGGTVTMAVDGAGRRKYDYDSLNATLSRRDYTYLPNGQLGSISGRNSSNQPYQVSIQYDTEGRPIVISNSGTGITNGTYELYHDDADRLIAVNVTQGTKTVRWHYHYLGTQPIGATREVTQSGTTTVKRFWFVYDERGLIHRAIDETYSEFYRAHYDASGWRTVDVLGDSDMWIPFLLPGQFVLDGTQAANCSPSCGSTRFQIVLNGKRAYDTVTGEFLTPDSLDIIARSTPEGYSFVRGNPLAWVDRNGASATLTYWNPLSPYPQPLGPGTSITFSGCSGEQANELISAIASAMLQVMTCDKGACAFAGGDEFRRHWLFALSSGDYSCPIGDDLMPNGTRRWEGIDYTNPTHFGRSQSGFAAITITPTGILGHMAWIAPAGFNGCLAQLVAHEAFHAAAESTAVENGGFSTDQPLYGQSRTTTSLATFALENIAGLNNYDGNETIDHTTTGHASEGIEGCVSCR